MTRVLVTGATGFIGRQCLAPLAAGYDVHAVSSSHDDGMRDGVVWHRADLLNAESARSVVNRVEPDALLHLAWYAVPGEYRTSLENFRWVQASLELFRAFADGGGRRIVCAGSCAEYDPTEGLCSEHSASHNASTPYAACKVALQLMLRAFAEETGVSAAWGRIFFAYGPFEYPERLVASVSNALVRGQPALCSHGRQIRDFLHVADVGSAFAMLVASDVRGPVNIASGEPVAIREVVNTLAVAAGRPDLVRLGALPTAGNEPPRLVADVRRLREELGWKPRYTLAAGLGDTLAWWAAAASPIAKAPAARSLSTT